ncbi:MAG: hypothetical protein H7A33_05470 [Deltaproteobacteria bacterium]|nr:hypothetical protein [Deltaproteobacteria bacterium]
MDSDFTGTLSEEDEDSEAFEEAQLFGSEFEEEASDGDEEEPYFEPTHLITFQFEAKLLIVDTKLDRTLVEINYNVRMEQEVEIKKARFRTKGKAEVFSENIGELASNELFSCELNIQIGKEEEPEPAVVEIMTRHNEREETEEEPFVSELALQLKFDKKFIMEDWFSNCTAIDGSVLNTKGEQEEFLHMILEGVEPNLNSLTFEDFEPDAPVNLNIETPETIMEDIDSNQEFIYTGQGSIDVEPL